MFEILQPGAIPMQTKTKAILTTLLLGAALPVFAAPVTLISDTFPEDFDNFTPQTSGSGTAGMTWSADNGVGGVPGRINAGSASLNHMSLVYYSGDGAAITWETATPYTASISFLPGTISGDISHVFSGFIRSTGSNFETGGSSVAGRMRNDGSGTYLTLYQQGSVVGSNSETFTLSNTLWYELETVMTLASATQGDLAVNLYSRGADGTAERTLIESISAANVTIGNSGFSESTFYAGFGGGNNSGSNIAAFDNFTVVAIPEPGTLALMGIALGSLLLFRRRR
jgi:hypothetical protein